MSGARRCLILLLGAFLFGICAVRPADSEAGKIRFVYMGSAGCKPCKQQNYKDQVAMIRSTARQWALEHHYAYVTTGVAVDEDRSAGEEFLAGIGTFDEIISGKGWEGATPYVKPYEVQNEWAILGVPQVVILLEGKPLTTPRELFRATGNMILWNKAVDVDASLKKSLEKR